MLLPARNAAPWLCTSLASLSRQRFSDFEIVAVDDGSTDGTGEMLERASITEPRLRVIHTGPRGLPSALNTALTNAKAPLVARHDADDLSHRLRFELQAGLLAARPELGVVGCRLRLFPTGGSGAGMRRWAAWHNTLLAHDEIAREALIDSPLAHGTAVVRRALLESVGGWAERGWPEDVDLWLRLLAAGARFEKLPRTLYAWRQHARGATRSDPRYRRERLLELKREFLLRGILARAGEATLVGVGRSLTEWRETLGVEQGGDRRGPGGGPPDRSGGIHLRALEAGRPTAEILAALRPPIVLVFGAREARARWRPALAQAGLRELEDFVFVA